MVPHIKLLLFMMLATPGSFQNLEVRMRNNPIYSRLSPIRWQPLPSL